MKKNLLLQLALAVLALPALAKTLPQGVYHLDPAHSKVGFEVSHLVIATVDGVFREAEATLDLNPDPRKSKITAKVSVASVDTGNAKRDKHLRSGDFFAVYKYPAMTFKSRSVKLKGNRLTVEGDLTLRGVTKSVVFEGKYRGTVKDGYGNEKVGASLRTTINRKDFGVAWNGMVEAGPVVGDDVDIVLNVEAGRPLNKK